MTTIKLKNGSGAPAGGDLVQGEPALDLTNKRLYTENASGTVIEVGTNPGVDVTFADNRKAIFGAGSDLQIYHDGSNSYLKDAGTGDLYIQGEANVRITDGDGNKMFLGQNDGEVQLYYNGSEKLNTTNTGIQVTGNISNASGDLTVDVAGSIKLDADSSNIYLADGGTDIGLLSTNNQDLNIRNLISNKDIYFQGNDGGSTITALTLNMSEAGEATFNSDILLGDGKVARFGTDQDFRIGFDGSTATLHNVTSDSDILFKGNDGGSTITALTLDMSNAGAATFNSSVTSTGLTVDGKINYTSAVNGMLNAPASMFINIDSDNNNTGEVFRVTKDADSTSGTKLFEVKENGNISFYEDTGTTAKLFWDASAESLGIGTSSPSTPLAVHNALSSGQAIAEFRSTGNSNSTIDLRADGTGDPQILFDLNGASPFALGVDNSDGDKFKISSGYQLGTNDRFVIDSTGRVGIGVSTPSNNHANANNLVVGNGTAGGIANYVGTGTGWYAFSRANANNSDAYDGGISYDGSRNLMFHTNAGAERMRIDSSGNLLVGVTSAQDFTSTTTSGHTLYGGTANVALHSRSGANALAVQRTTNDGALVNFFKDTTAVGSIASVGGADIKVNFSSDADQYITGNAAANYLSFSSANAERMRLDSSGNLLVGKTSNAFGTEGANLVAGGHFVKDGNSALYLNRLSSDGSILALYKDSTSVGSIGVSGGNNLFISGQAANHAGLTFATDAILPTRQGSLTDNVTDLGASSERFVDIYATNGTIQTSDRNEKQDIEALSDAEQRVAVACKGLLRKFRWKSSVAENGDDARIHFGIIAQDLQDAFTAEGLDAGRYAMFTSTTWTDEETGEERTRMGVRYSELLAFIIATI